MWTYRWLCSFVIAGLVIPTAAVRAQDNTQDPLVERVRIAIEKGVDFLKKTQQDRGRGEWNWENTILGAFQPGGPSCLATLALLTSGVKPDDPVIKRTMPYIRGLEAQHVYVTGLQTMVLAEVNAAVDLDLIQRNVNWLIKARVMRDGRLQGWGYTLESSTPDNSNSQYALLGLLAGRQAGAKIDKVVWESIQEYYIRTQIVDKAKNWGGWGYHNPGQIVGATGVSHTMTVAGACGLFISSLELNTGKQELNERTGIAAKCGEYDENEAVARAMRWLATNLSFNSGGYSFYNVYGIERVGRLSGQRFIGDHDWYRVGCELMTGVKQANDFMQKPDGSWSTGADAGGVITTSFALLFLSKGRMPILISKLAYNTLDKNPHEWNRKHHDARHMVEYASRELFKKMPLAWQVFDPRSANLNDPRVFNEELIALRQSPILYFNGHYKPDLSDAQIRLLSRYVEEGGFILGEACCGSKEFTEGFQEIMKQVIPESPMRPIGPDHPVWKAHALIRPTDFPGLQGIERGCRTVVMLSTEPLAGFWEEFRFAPKAEGDLARGQLAFRLAGNIIAYATSLEPPKPRLTRVKLSDSKEEAKLPRHTLKLAQLKVDVGHRDAKLAIRNLASYLKDTYKLDVSLDLETIRMVDTAAAEYKVLYMHGREKFTFDKEELDNARFNLMTGGILLADACCGQKNFDEAFRAYAKELFPGSKLERIPEDDYLFSEKLNGTGKAITKVKCRTEDAAQNKDGLKEMAPFLEGIKYEGRWVVIYSRYDLGCALEKNKAISCLAYDEESAQRLASSIILYSLKR